MAAPVWLASGCSLAQEPAGGLNGLGLHCPGIRNRHLAHGNQSEGSHQNTQMYACLLAENSRHTPEYTHACRLTEGLRHIQEYTLARGLTESSRYTSEYTCAHRLTESSRHTSEHKLEVGTETLTPSKTLTFLCSELRRQHEAQAKFCSFYTATARRTCFIGD